MTFAPKYILMLANLFPVLRKLFFISSKVNSNNILNLCFLKMKTQPFFAEMNFQYTPILLNSQILAYVPFDDFYLFLFPYMFCPFGN